MNFLGSGGGGGARLGAGGLGAREVLAELAREALIESSRSRRPWASFVSCSLMDLVRNFSAFSKSPVLIALLAMFRHLPASSAFIFTRMTRMDAIKIFTDQN